MKTTELENLIQSRDKLFKTINNLEMGVIAEKKKIDEFEFFKNDSNFDKSAMETQVIRSKENLKQIEIVLNLEKEKLKNINKEIEESNKILKLHGVKPCLTGAVPHTWHILSRHPSGQFSYRKCLVCDTSEKVGYV